MGLLQLAPSGKAHLIPITILYDGEFYDASAYKAAPVPMALESGTVYEAVRAGVSQGLFTVSSALQGQQYLDGRRDLEVDRRPCGGSGSGRQEEGSAFEACP